MLTLEYKRKFEFAVFVDQIMHHKEYQLSAKYKHKFGLRIKYGVILMIFCCHAGFIIISLFSFVFEIIACLKCEREFAVIFYGINFIIYLISTYYIISIFVINSFCSFLVTLYLKYRFNHLEHCIDTYMKTGIYPTNNLVSQSKISVGHITNSIL